MYKYNVEKKLLYVILAVSSISRSDLTKTDGFDATLHLPLCGEDPVEVCAAGVSWLVLFGKDIGQNVKALSASSILTYQLSLQERCPASL